MPAIRIYGRHRRIEKHGRHTKGGKHRKHRKAERHGRQPWLAFGLAAILATGIIVPFIPAEAQIVHPSAPSNLHVVRAANNSITVAWNAAPKSIGPVKYQVYQIHNLAHPAATTAGTTTTLNHLRPNTTYWLAVKTVTAKGTKSVSSNVVIATTRAYSSTWRNRRQERMVGYYTSWSTYTNFQVNQIPADRLDFINYAFANISNGQVVLGDPYADTEKTFPGDSSSQGALNGNFGQLLKLKQRDPHLKTLISVGGWTWSGQFSNVASTPQSRDEFANSAVAFIKKYGFDGVDIDWEYPVSGGQAGNTNSPADKQNFTLLLQDLRQKLNAQGQIDHTHYYLTIAAAANSSYVKNTELAKIAPLVDWINLMTYDMHGPWDNYTGLVSGLNVDTKDPAKVSDSGAVQLFLKQGVPANKIVLGAPFYGYEYPNVSSSVQHGLYQPFSGTAKSITYNSVMTQDFGKNGFVRYWDSAAEEPWLFNGSEFISYEDPVSIYYKTRYANQNHLGGMMFWELSGDFQNRLLSTVYYNLK